MGWDDRIMGCYLNFVGRKYTRPQKTINSKYFQKTLPELIILQCDMLLVEKQYIIDWHCITNDVETLGHCIKKQKIIIHRKLPNLIA